MVGIPPPLVGGYMDNFAVGHMGVDDATTTAIMAAGAGNDRFPSFRFRAGCFVNGLAQSISSRKRNKRGANK